MSPTTSTEYLRLLCVARDHKIVILHRKKACPCLCCNLVRTVNLVENVFARGYWHLPNLTILKLGIIMVGLSNLVNTDT